MTLRICGLKFERNNAGFDFPWYQFKFDIITKLLTAYEILRNLVTLD